MTIKKDQFSADAIQSMADYLKALLQIMVNHPDGLLGNVPGLLPLALPVLATQTMPFVSVLNSILSQAKQTPNNIAVHVNDEVISYAELVDWSLAIADELVGLGLKPGNVVALCLPRGALMIAAQLAVLMQGAVLLPLEPDAPDARLGFMLDDAEASLVLTIDAWSERFAGKPILSLPP
ncbi:AMP-binding protein, partial [Methylocucumis oryzae]|uniref:AMP-binding protein n=1 Tax=Methylocucumis oryzae TaxID=1632867 RepID=UPI0012FEDA75